MRVYAYLLTALLVTTTATATENYGVVELTTSTQAYDQSLPWKKTPPRMINGFALMVSSNEYISLEGLVRSATLTQLRQPRSGERLEVRTAESAVDANLTLLRAPRSFRDKQPTPFTLAKKWPDTKTVTIVQLDGSRDIQTGTAEILKSEVSRLANGGGSGLTFLLRSDMALNGQGCAVVHEDKLIGIVTSYDRNSRQATVIPCATLNKFLTEVRSNNYRGFATAGFSWTPLTDPVKKKYLNVPDNENGILITSLRPGTGAMETFDRQDVILTWDGRDIDTLGYYDDPDYGRLLISYLIKGHRRPGEKVTVRIVREGKIQEVVVELMSSSSTEELIPEDITEQPPEYLVEGGIVFRELTGRYLRSFGSNWEQKVNSRLAYLYYDSRRTAHEKGKRIVIISRILPHKINTGYESFQLEMVTHANNQAVKDMNDLFTIREKDGHISRLRLFGSSVDLVLDKKTLKEANAHISANYGITSESYRAARD